MSFTLSSILTNTIAGATGATGPIGPTGPAGSGTALIIQDEGSNVTTSATSINFVGSAVAASAVGNTVTVTITGGSGGSSNASVTGYSLVFGG